MQNKNKKILVLFIILTAIFIVSIVRLFVLRFESGDVYPTYSSLRSDPLGTKVFYESLNNLLPGSVTRNYHFLSKIDMTPDTTLLYLGVHTYELTLAGKKKLNAFDQITVPGGRVIVSFLPIQITDPKNKSDEEKKDTKASPDKDEKTSCNKDKSDCCKKKCDMTSISKRWGVDFGYEETGKDLSDAVYAEKDGKNVPISAISWHTALYFKDLNEAWEVICTRNNHPVIIERNIGRGSVVLSTDSYFLSNEAMQKERHPELLAWVVGNKSTIIFDESHFGIQKSLGIADLAQKYRLYWVFFGALVFAGLFVWRNSTYFIPPEDSESSESQAVASSRDNTAGLISLLRRNVRPEDILNICSLEWKKSFVPKKDVSNKTKEKLRKINDLIVSEKKSTVKKSSLVKTYQTICITLSKKKYYQKKP